MVDGKIPIARTYSKDVIKYMDKYVHNSTTK